MEKNPKPNTSKLSEYEKKKNNIIEQLKFYGEEIVKKYSKNAVLEPTYKILQKYGELLINLKYFFCTDLNPFQKNIEFYILVSDNFPKFPPSVKCRTNFCYPTLYDNRELMESIISHNWSPDKGNPLKSLEEIVLKIPSFLKTVHENISNRTLYYYGKYEIEGLYNLNHFIENDTNAFFRTFFYGSEGNKIEKFLIVTDQYFLAFDPIEEQKNLGILTYYTDIRDIKEIGEGKYHTSVKKDSIILIAKDVSFEITVMNKDGNELKNLLNKNKNHLSAAFQIFHNPGEISEMEANYADLNDMKNLKNIIEYKEKIYAEQGKKSLNMIKNLITLYEKMVELLSAKGDEEFMIYLNKLKNMIKEQSTFEEEDGEKLFNNSKPNQ